MWPTKKYQELIIEQNKKCPKKISRIPDFPLHNEIKYQCLNYILCAFVKIKLGRALGIWMIF